MSKQQSANSKQPEGLSSLAGHAQTTPDPLRPAPGTLKPQLGTLKPQNWFADCCLLIADYSFQTISLTGFNVPAYSRRSLLLGRLIKVSPADVTKLEPTQGQSNG
jgi:hypothetical protein